MTYPRTVEEIAERMIYCAEFLETKGKDEVLANLLPWIIKRDEQLTAPLIGVLKEIDAMWSGSPCYYEEEVELKSPIGIIWQKVRKALGETR